MPRASKKFVIISNQVNNYGYRVDTAGMDLEQYKRNPVLLFMHQRATWNQDAKPIGHIQDIQLEANGDITGVPFFTDHTEHAKEVYKLVEDGTYKMLSAGFEPGNLSEDPEDIYPGQRYATVKTSKLREVSVVDIGGDDNAMCLYHNNELLRLDGSNDSAKIIPLINQNKIENQMDKQLIPMLMLVGLSHDANMEQLMAKINELKLKADEAEQHAATIVTLNDTIGTLQKAAIDTEINTLLDAAVDQRKITAEQKPFYKQMGDTNLESLKSLLSTMPSVKTLAAELEAENDAENPLLKLDYKQAHTSNKLAEIKAKHPEHYKLIFKAHFGREPQA